MENQGPAHPGIHQTMPHDVAKQRYEEYRSSCSKDAAPVFVLWWYMQETTPPVGPRVGHLDPGYIEFEDWLQVRNLAV